MASKMLHTCIRVKDLDKSLKFYKEALGLIETRRMYYPEYKFSLVYLSDKEDGYEVVTAPEDFAAVRDALQEKGYEFISSEVKMIPQTTTELTEEEQLKNMNKLIDMLEDDDDVQNVYHNWEIAE